MVQSLPTEGELASRWLVLDCGTVVIHIMDPERRDFYRLEELWGRERIVRDDQPAADQGEP